MINQRHITFDREKYDSEADFWADITTMIKVLTNNDYEVLFRLDDCSIYVLEFAYDSNHVPEFGEDRFMLVTEEEEEAIIDARLDARSNNKDEDGIGKCAPDIENARHVIERE